MATGNLTRSKKRVARIKNGMASSKDVLTRVVEMMERNKVLLRSNCLSIILYIVNLLYLDIEAIL